MHFNEYFSKVSKKWNKFVDDLSLLIKHGFTTMWIVENIISMVETTSPAGKTALGSTGCGLRLFRKGQNYQ